MIGIYKFTNKLTGESYIGQSRDINRRYIQHKNRHEICLHEDSPKEDTYFHSMLRHYGFHNFDFEVLEECEISELNEKEIYYIDKYNTFYPNGYNKTKGGHLPHLVSLKSFEDVDNIFELLKDDKYTNSEIAKMYNITPRMISDINVGKVWRKDNVNYPIRDGLNVLANKRTIYSKKKCFNCGKDIDKKSKHSLCKDCYNQQLSKNIPDKDTLLNLLSKNSFVSVGKIYGVTGNAVRKWCDKYNIPRHSSYYRTAA